MTTQHKTIGELAEVLAGFNPRPDERRKTGKYVLLGGRNIQNGQMVSTPADSFVMEIDRGSFQRAIARPGDIVVSTLFDRRKLMLYTADNPPAVVNNSCAIIRSASSADYIISYLRTMQGRDDFLAKASKATSGAFIPRLSLADLASIQIPILPIAELARLGDRQIEHAAKPDLLKLKRELESKDAEIATLKAQNADMALFYENRLRAVESQIAINDLLSRIKHNETATLEFKSTLRWNIKSKADGSEIENAVLKTIAAFCNTKGGELLIGVTNECEIIGIESDHFPDNDKFMLHLRNLITDRLTPCLVEFVEYEMVSLSGKWICHVQCKQSSRGVWLKSEKNKPSQFYVRHGPSSTQLDGPEAVDYIQDHFQK